MLTDSAIRNTKPTDKPFKLTDSNGLILEVKPNGSRFWRYRYKIDGKENMLALGEYCQAPAKETAEAAQARRDGRHYTLAEARIERDRCRALVRQGIHPAQERKIETMRRSLENENTFQAVAETWIKDHGAEWSAGYRRQIEQGFKRDVFPYVGALPMKAIKPAHVLDVQDRVQKRSAAMAKLTRTWIGGVFRYAVSRLLVEDDPTYPLRGSLKVPKVQHHPHLTAKELPTFLRALDGAVAEFPTLAACKLMFLTVVRANELRNAEWSEFDLDAALWRIPAERMKMREEHVVPLTRQALDLLRALYAVNGATPYVFPSRSDRKKPMSHEAIRDVFSRIGYAGKFTPHGVRATFSTIANDMGIRHDVIELCLALQERNAVRRAYNHALLLPERTALLQQWADMLDAMKAGGKVIPFKAA